MATFEDFPAGMPHDTQSFTPEDRAVLTETTRLLMMFAASQHSTNELLLLRTAVNADVRLKPRDIGLFEPTRMPDPLAAIHFIDDFTTAATCYGEEATRKVLWRCCANEVARGWIAGLDDDDRLALQCSTRDWERLIRRDFFPSREIREDQASAEKFEWTQNRTPAEYMSSKMTLLRIAGITDHDRVVREIHRGFKACPEIQIHLQKYVKDSGNRISEYRCKVQTYQDDARLLYERSPRFKSYQHGHADGFLGNRRMNDHSKPPPTPKRSECRYCGAEFHSRSRLHTHLRTTAHQQRAINRHEPEQCQRSFFGIAKASTATGASNRRPPEPYQRAFMGITVPSMAPGTPTTIPLGPEETYSPTPAARRPAATPLEPQKASEESWCIDIAETVSSAADETYIPTPPDSERFNNNTGYVGVTFKERGYPRSLVSDRASLRSSFTTIPAVFSLSVRLSSSILRDRSAARRQHLRKVRRKLIHWQARPGKFKRRRVK